MHNLDARKAYAHAKALAFPRRTGSGGEAEAAGYIVNRLKELGLEVREEGFSFLSFVLGFFLKAAILSLLFLLSFIFFLFPFNPFLTGILSLLALILIGFSISGIPLVASLRSCLFRNVSFLDRPSLAPTERRMGRQGSKNIIATLKEGTYPPQKREGHEGPPYVVFLAHYDSKSQSLPLVLRIVLMGVFLSGSIVILGFYLFVAITGGFSPGGWLYVTYSITNFAGVLLLLTWTGNHSPGAIDNASGVGILLHLAEIISRERERFKGLSITFAFTGAEEEGLAGAFVLSNSLKGLLSRDNTYFINLDGLGPKGRIYCTHKIGLHPTFTKGQGRLVSLIKESADKEGIKVYSPPLVIGAMADHFPFVFEGFNAVTLSAVSRRSLVVHTPRDTMEQIDLEGLEEVGRLLLRIIEDLKM